MGSKCAKPKSKSSHKEKPHKAIRSKSVGIPLREWTLRYVEIKTFIPKPSGLSSRNQSLYDSLPDSQCSTPRWAEI